jgi:DNA-binding MarR family transcriptional regulator
MAMLTDMPPAEPAPRAPHRDPVTAEVIDLFSGIFTTFNQEYEKAAAAHGLTGVQAQVLAVLRDRTTSMRTLARVMRCEPSNITGIIDRLEARGLVERRPDPADRRVKLLAITDTGRDLAQRVRADLHFAADPLAALTPEERAILRDLLHRVHEG